MPIQPNNIAATPNDMESLMAWCDAHSGSEKSVAIVAAMMSWNLACKIIQDDQDNVDAANAAIDYAEIEALGEFIHRVGEDMDAIDNGREAREHG